MKSKILFILTILFLQVNEIYSQDRKVGVCYTRTFVDKDFDPNKVFYKETGLKVSTSELRKLTNENSRMYFEREIDAEGNVIRYLYDSSNQNGNRMTDTTIIENGVFPNFKFTTIDKKKIELADLKGKLVILRFELEAESFRFKKHEIEELDRKINALKNKADIEAIIIFQCAEEEVRRGFNLNDSNFKLVANGKNFIFKYDIHQFPSTLLVDKNGKLIDKYSYSDDIPLDQLFINE